MSHTIGYARVSSTGQKLDVQRELLEKEGCNSIFEEKVSGANRDRPELNLMLRTIREGDCVVVAKLDRLARSIVDFWNLYNEIEEKGASLIILDMALDTSNGNGKMVLGVMASVAEWEREIIKERQADGILSAKAKGKHLGRPKLTEEVKAQVMAMLKSGSTKQSVSDELNIGISTVYKIQKETKGS